MSLNILADEGLRAAIAALVAGSERGAVMTGDVLVQLPSSGLMGARCALGNVVNDVITLFSDVIMAPAAVKRNGCDCCVSF